MLVHAETLASLNTIRQQPVHAIMLVGEAGAGKLHLAQRLVHELLAHGGDDVLQNPYVTLIDAESKSISIEEIRTLHSFMQLKTIGKNSIRRAAIIKDAHRMTVEAQNALLKLLEEPPSDSIIVLTSHPATQLKPTIYSRVMQVQVKPVGLEAALAHYGQLSTDERTIHQAHAISGGSAALLDAILQNDEAHPLSQSILEAKKLLALPLFERLCRIDSLSKDKQELTLLLQSLLRIARAGVIQAAAASSTKQHIKWLQVLNVLHESCQAMQHNPNTKLLLTHLFVRL